MLRVCCRPSLRFVSPASKNARSASCPSAARSSNKRAEAMSLTAIRPFARLISAASSSGIDAVVPARVAGAAAGGRRGLADLPGDRRRLSRERLQRATGAGTCGPRALSGGLIGGGDFGRVSADVPIAAATARAVVAVARRAADQDPVWPPWRSGRRGCCDAAVCSCDRRRRLAAAKLPW